jgi:hypothetical protein
MTRRATALVLTLAALTVAACGGNDQDQPTPSGADIQVAFPQLDGAQRLGAARLDAGQLAYAGNDAVGMAHLVDREAATIDDYNSGLLAQGWRGGGIGRNEFIEYDIWARDQLVVVVTVVPGRVAQERPDALATVDLGPFRNELDDLGADETLIYTQSATCAEPSIDDCMQKAFARYAEKLKS